MGSGLGSGVGGLGVRSWGLVELTDLLVAVLLHQARELLVDQPHLVAGVKG